MGQFVINQRVLFWDTPTSIVSGRVAKISEGEDVVLVIADNGNRYLKPASEVFVAYGRQFR